MDYNVGLCIALDYLVQPFQLSDILLSRRTHKLPSYLSEVRKEVYEGQVRFQTRGYYDSDLLLQVLPPLGNHLLEYLDRVLSVYLQRGGLNVSGGTGEIPSHYSAISGKTRLCASDAAAVRWNRCSAAF